MERLEFSFRQPGQVIAAVKGEEVATCVGFCCPTRAGFMTGAELLVDGGLMYD